MADSQTKKLVPKLPVGVKDFFAGDVIARQQMIETICGVYRQFGFAPLETPGIEYLDVIGKYLPEADQPDSGVFAFKDDDGQWLSLRYDLTAPLSRVAAQYAQDLPTPYRRYQVGPVFRREKPGPGRFRQFYQCDFDTVGSASPAADAEVCLVLVAAFEALGIARRDFQVRVSNRKLLDGVLETLGLGEATAVRLAVMRNIDKLDRLGVGGVADLLGKGRMDPSGDFTKGVGLSPDQIKAVLEIISGGDTRGDRTAFCERMRRLVGKSDSGIAAIRELEQINLLLDAEKLDSTIVPFDPTIVRGLEYYTGPVFEAVLTFAVTDESGAKRSFGSVAGGGRYDGLVKRFLEREAPATGASIGVDRLIDALRELRKVDQDTVRGPVVVTIMDEKRLVDYQQMVSELRNAGIPAELYLGTERKLGAQLTYADKRQSPVAVIAGGDEFEKGQVTIKDLGRGAELAKTITDRNEYRKRSAEAQFTIARNELVAAVRKIVGG